MTYKTPEDFNAVVRANKGLDWIKQELRSLPEVEAKILPILSGTNPESANSSHFRIANRHNRNE